MLWILASVALALLLYEIPTLLFSVLGPLLANPNALQTDFHYYYDAAVRYGADRSRLYPPSDDVIAGFTYPPPAIVPFLLLSKLPLGVALATMTIASYAALIDAAATWSSYLRRHGVEVDRRSHLAVMLIAIASGPSYMNAIFGQVNAFVLLAAVVFVARAAAMPAIAGVALAAGTWLKIYPAFLALIGAWDAKVWRAIAIAVLAAIAVAVALLPVVPYSAYEAFAALLAKRADVTAIHVTNQSLIAFLERFRYSPDLFLNWTGQQAVVVTPVVRIMHALISLLLVLKCWYDSRRHGADLPSIAASMIALVAVIAPLGWGHTYVMVLPLVMLQLVAMRDAPRPMALLIFVCVMAMMIPAGRHLPIDSAPSWLQNVVYSRYLLATLALIAISTVSVGRTTKSTLAASA
ncbi:MAG TPA: glycosyltransferase family 87 protein [Vicinamibacterales bacterium]